MTSTGLGATCNRVSVQFESDRSTQGAFFAVQELDLAIRPGEIVALIGPSGCGKTTLLNVLAGFVNFTGEVRVGHSGPGRRRDVGYMFQRDSLLPWRTLLKNVEFPLEVRKVAAEERRRIAQEYLARVGLGEFTTRYPHTVSGGMQKRVALAQILCYGPQLLLLDEPFSALDAFTRASVEQDLLDMLASNGATAVIVTHDLNEAISLADRVVIMKGPPGRITAIHDVNLGRPRNLLDVQYGAPFAAIRDRIWADLRQEVIKADA